MQQPTMIEQPKQQMTVGGVVAVWLQNFGGGVMLPSSSAWLRLRFMLTGCRRCAGVPSLALSCSVR